MTKNKFVCLVFLLLSVLSSLLCSCEKEGKIITTEEKEDTTSDSTTEIVSDNNSTLERYYIPTENDIDANGIYQDFSWGTSFSDCYDKLTNCRVKPADSTGEKYIPAELFFQNYNGLYSKRNFLSQISFLFYDEKLETVVIDIYPSDEDIEKFSEKDDPLQAAHEEMYSFVIEEFSKRFGNGEIISRVDSDDNSVQINDLYSYIVS